MGNKRCTVPIVGTKPLDKRPRGQNKRTLIRQALTELDPARGEMALWLAVSRQALAGDAQSAAILANRLIPVLPPDCELVALPRPLTGTPSEQAATILGLVAKGELTTLQGRAFVTLISESVKIAEGSELLRRLEAIEARLNSKVVDNGD